MIDIDLYTYRLHKATLTCQQQLPCLHLCHAQQHQQPCLWTLARCQRLLSHMEGCDHKHGSQMTLLARAGAAASHSHSCDARCELIEAPCKTATLALSLSALSLLFAISLVPCSTTVVAVANCCVHPVPTSGGTLRASSGASASAHHAVTDCDSSLPRPPRYARHTQLHSAFSNPMPQTINHPTLPVSASHITLHQ